MKDKLTNELRFNRKYFLSVLIIFAAVLVLYGAGSLSPDSFLWGVNHLAFLEPTVRMTIVISALLVGLLFLVPRIQVKAGSFFRSQPLSTRTVTVSIVLAGIVGAGVFYYFRIGTDMYGDTRTLLALLAEKQYTLKELFDFSEKEPLTRFIHQQIAVLTGIDQKIIFQFISVISGGVYIVLILVFVRSTAGSGIWKFLAVLIALFSGVNQLFFGHVEDYTLVYLAIIIFLILGWKYFDGGKVLGGMTLVFIIGVRLHIEMILLLPALLYVVLHSKQTVNPKIQRWLQPKRIAGVVAVSMVGAALVYLFYFQAYRYEAGDQKEIITKFFLPVINPLPPPHSYTLVSLNHLSDVVQQFLFIAAPAVVFILYVSIGWYRSLRWKEPRVVFFLLAVFYFTVFDFTINPMLTMPRDWDLLSPAAGPIIFLAIILLHQYIGRDNYRNEWFSLAGIGIVVSLLSGVIFYINSSQERAGLRLEGIGKWAFKSYYHGSSYMINVGEKMLQDVDEQIEHRKKTIEDLFPYASKPDNNLSLLYYKLAVVYYDNRQFDQAALNAEKALDHDSGNASALKALGLCAIQNRDMEKAIRIFSFYNRNVNRSAVNDRLGLRLGEVSRQLLDEIASGVDSMVVQKKIDELFPLLK